MMQEPKWLGEKRNEAFARFTELDLPKEREEEWRYTTLKEINFNADESEVIMEGETDGIYTDLLSAIAEHPEIIRKYLGRAVEMNDKFSAFHYANLANGILIVIPDFKTARLAVKATGCSHSIIVTGKGSKLIFSEEYSGKGFATEVTEIFAGEDSSIDIVSIHKGEGKRFSFKGSKLSRNSSINWALVSKSEDFQRIKMDNVMEGEGARSEILCGFLGKKGHTDFMVSARHLAPGTTNNIFAKGVLYGTATSVFRGKIDIEKNAQKTDSYMADHMLLMSEDAVSNSVPSLKIDANDVKASHGATVGQVDEEQLFYLQSRGLSEQEAEKLIVDGFFTPLVERVRDGELREAARRMLI